MYTPLLGTPLCPWTSFATCYGVNGDGGIVLLLHTRCTVQKMQGGFELTSQGGRVGVHIRGVLPRALHQDWNFLPTPVRFHPLRHRPMSAHVTFRDSDGDLLDFRLDDRGTLKEYVNNQFDTDVTRLTYTRSKGLIEDDGGSFVLPPGQQSELAVALHVLAAQAGVAWCGDTPDPVGELQLEDQSGRHVNFSLTPDGQLQETAAGYRFAGLNALEYCREAGTVSDFRTVFTIREPERFAKAAVLRTLAARAGVAWRGDALPLPSGDASEGLLDIENCAADWELRCPKKWGELRATPNAKERFCETCRETVYFCHTKVELEAHTAQRRCVAFDMAAPAPQSSGASPRPTSPRPTGPAQRPARSPGRRMMGKRVAPKS